MATVNYNVNVNTAQGVQALQQLQNKVGQTSEIFGKLRNAVAGLAIGTFVADAYNSANALTDMAKAAGISTQSLLGFRDAVKANGGEANAAVDSMGKFSQAIESAANGSKEMQDRFLKLGITLNDLRTLSEQDLLARVVKGLGQGTAGAETMAIAMGFFGKQFRSVDFKGVAADIDRTTESAAEAARAYESAGDAQQKFANSIGKVQTELLKALTPISDAINGILEFGEGVRVVARLVIQIALAAAAFTALGRVLTWLRAGVVALAEGWAFLTGAVSGVINFFKNFGAIVGEVAGASKMGGSALGVLRIGFGELGAWIVKNIPALAALGIALAGIWDALKTGINAISEFLGFGEAQKNKNGEITDSEKAKAAQIREVTDALNKEKAALTSLLDAFNRANEEANRKIVNDTALINLGEQQRVSYERQLEAYNRYITEYNKLSSQFDEKARSGSPTDQAMTGQIAETMNKLTEAYKANTAVIQENVAAYVQAQQAKQLDLFNTKSLIDSQNQLKTIQDDIAKSTMSEIERKYYDIEAASRASAKAAIEAEEARRNQKMPIEEQKAYYEAAARGNEELKAATEEQYRNSRKWSTGWTSAFKDYAENAFDAAEEARRVFQIAAQGMEDALMNFIKRGKFEWKNFVQLMVDELLRSQIRQLISNIGGGLQTTGAGLFGGISKLLGFANGGIIPTNGPVVVGERGPELLFGAAGMSVTPNSQLGGSTNVVYNINAVDAFSFKQLVARDPSFIHAVAMAGASTVPSRR